ncbi:MAG: hypothetical protein PVH68_09135 [Armatimonadota bacterium]|jgi:hypothetical protein
MSQYIEPCIDRSVTTERALALLLMIDDGEAADGPIIAELSSQLQEQLARGDVANECERALVQVALGRANVALPSH